MTGRARSTARGGPVPATSPVNPPASSPRCPGIGPITRVGLDSDAWEELPTRMTIDGRVVHIDSFPVGDDTVLITRGGNDIFSLLVVPPQTVPTRPAPPWPRPSGPAARRRRNRSSSTPAPKARSQGRPPTPRYATAAMSRAADDALVRGGTTRRSQRPEE
ncbi:hypothetical protein SVIOM342S_08761 [Streptomyces violaceorubidus]